MSETGVSAASLPVMTSRFFWFVILPAGFLSAPLAAWNSTGHRAVAAIAYKKLDEATKQKIAVILRQHPDFSTWTQGVQTLNEEDENRVAFIAAATWPDAIKSDPRFHETGDPDTSHLHLPGFPDMERHRNWHFIDRPINPDNLAIPPLDPDNALAIINEFIAALKKPDVEAEEKAFMLPWLLHLIGDVHQPLHSSSRYAAFQKKDAAGRFKGDRGGNDVELFGTGGNLHSFWDGLVGSAQSDTFVTALSNKLMADFPETAGPVLTPETWIDESFEAAKNVAYQFSEKGTHNDPARLSNDYRKNARETARQRVAVAGYRLSGVLKDVF